jgi:Zn-dependent M28 family amino/carboxypeptidase
MVTSPNATWQMGRDFVTRSISDLQVENAGLVFIGYGLEEDGYNDLEGLDLKDKGVVMISGTPKDKNGDDLFDDVPNFRQIYSSLMEKGVKFLITMPLTEDEAQSRISLFGTGVTKPRLSLDKGETRRSSAPSLIASPSAVARLFGESPASFQKFLEKSVKKGKVMGGKYSTTTTVKFDYRDGAVPSENVLGFMEGTDLKDEIVVITSHYDHVGISNSGEINNGADDDGSGTVSVLEIVDAFATAAEEGNRPRRSILFMTVTGEEKGLLGSSYYSDNPIFPLNKTVTNLNIDMIGRIDPDRADDPDYVYIIGSTMLSSDLHKISESVAGKFVKNLELDYKYNSKDDPNRFYYRSDHYNFAKHNIPIIFYFNGTHPDYHRPTDTPDKIEYELMEKRAQLVFVTAWEIANRSKAPVVDQVDNKD